MPSWKKVITSGSAAALNSLTVSNGITGSLFGTASYALTASNSQNAQDILIYVKNVTGAQINKGKVVRISGATGDNALIATASYESDGLSANTLGITNQDIPHDSFGYVITEGTLVGINTNTFSAGQLLYLGATGSIIGTAPVAPLHAVRLGQVLRVQLNNGSMYVRIDNGYELGELHDVVDNTTTSSYGDLLVKSGSVWINSKQLTGSYGLTGSLNVNNGTVTLDNSAGTLIVTSSQAIALQVVGGNNSNNIALFKNVSTNATVTTIGAGGNIFTSGSVTAPGGLIGTASVATTSVITDNPSFNNNYYPAFVQGAGNSNLQIDTSTFTYNPSTNLLTTTASFATNASTASYVLNAISSSFASTASFVNTLNQSVLITGSVTVGALSAGASENSLTLGARDTGSEGGQIGFNAPGGTYTSASFIDNWQNKVRILKGNNTTSTGLVAQWDLHTTQMNLPGYTAASSFVGTATANLAVNSNGDVITVSTTGGSVFPYTGNAVITGSLTTTGIIYAQPNGGMYFQGGDDAALYDINISNHMGIYGVQNSTVGAIKLGSNGPVLYGSGSSLGIGTTNPSSASLTVSGNVWATSLTGSLFGTASFAISSSRAVSASMAVLAPSYLPLAGGTMTGDISAAGRTFTFQDLVLGSGTTQGTIKTDGTKYIGIFPTNGVESTRFLANGSVMHGTSFTDTGYRLQVSASSAVSGALQVIGNSVMTGSLNVSGSININSEGSYIGADAQAVPRLGFVKLSGAQPFLGFAQSSFDLKVSSGTTIATSNTFSPVLTVKTTGEVGIGTVTPNAKLDVNGDVIITGSLTVTGRITAEEFHTEFVSSSIIYQSGSTKFGDSSDDVMSVTGSLRVNGGITGSLFGTSSNALTASNITPAITTGNTNNNIVTANGNGTLTGESNLTFDGTLLTQVGSFKQGGATSANGNNSHAEGDSTSATGNNSHAEGKGPTSFAQWSHAEGYETYTSGETSHAEGWRTRTIGQSSHAEGYYATSSGDYSHAEGSGSISSGISSHAEGGSTLASGSYSHAEGHYTTTQGYASHAEGVYTHALGDYSHAAGNYTSASGNYQSVIGQYNLPLTTPGAFIIGNGIGTGARSNLLYTSGSQVQVTGSVIATQGFTGSLLGTASYATQALSASWAPATTTAATASFVTSSNVYGPNGSNSILSASFAVSSSYAVSASSTVSSSRAVSSSYAVSSSNALTASFVVSSSYAVSSSNAATASWATNVTNNGVTSVSASGTVSGITLGGGTITSTGTLTLSGTVSGLTNSNLSGTAGITNANLATPSLMIGTTNIALGATGSTLAGLTSVAATTFTGALTGNASTATSASFASTASFLNGGTTNAFIQNGNSFGATALLGTNDNNPLAFETNGTTRMFISSSGDVGIGTANPVTRLDVQTSGTVQTSILGRGSDGNFRFTTRQDTSTNTDGSVIGELGIDYTTTRNSAIRFHRGGSTTGGFMTFTTNDGSERMRIFSSGNVFIGSSPTDAGYKLDVNGNTNITGTLTATVKSFIIDHPTKEGKKLQYGVLEGPEHSVYVRGKLTNSNTITLPDHWTGLVHQDTITVNLTPIGKRQDLWVETVTDTAITVGSDNEINCFYTVFAERKDIEKLVTEFDK